MYNPGKPWLSMIGRYQEPCQYPGQHSTISDHPSNLLEVGGFKGFFRRLRGAVGLKFRLIDFGASNSIRWFVTVHPLKLHRNCPIRKDNLFRKQPYLSSDASASLYWELYSVLSVEGLSKEL